MYKYTVTKNIPSYVIGSKLKKTLIVGLFQTIWKKQQLPFDTYLLSQWTLKKSLNFIFPTKYVIPKSLKFSHWPRKHIENLLSPEDILVLGGVCRVKTCRGFYVQMIPTLMKFNPPVVRCWPCVAGNGNGDFLGEREHVTGLCMGFVAPLRCCGKEISDEMRLIQVDEFLTTNPIGCLVGGFNPFEKY